MVRFLFYCFDPKAQGDLGKTSEIGEKNSEKNHTPVKKSYLSVVVRQVELITYSTQLSADAYLRSHQVGRG